MAEHTGTGAAATHDLAEAADSGRLTAALARAVVGTYREYRGRGPTKAHAFYRREVVVVMMENTMTQGERSLVADGKSDAVLEMRREFQLTMRTAMVSAVESLTGTGVRAVMSANHVDPDVALGGLHPRSSGLDRAKGLAPASGDRSSSSRGSPSMPLHEFLRRISRQIQGTPGALPVTVRLGANLVNGGPPL